MICEFLTHNKDEYGNPVYADADYHAFSGIQQTVGFNKQSQCLVLMMFRATPW